MIASLQGTLEYQDAASAVISVGGVGFSCQMSTGSLAALGALGSTVHVETLLQVRADALTLFAFSSNAERALFERLTSVSGVGGKSALALLSAYAPAELSLIIQTGDAARLATVSGIGKKTAQRIILELQGLLAAGEGAPSAAAPGTAAGEASLALEAMGFSASEIARALADVALEVPANVALGEGDAGSAGNDVNASALVRQALKRLG